MTSDLPHVVRIINVRDNHTTEIIAQNLDHARDIILPLIDATDKFWPDAQITQQPDDITEDVLEIDITLFGDPLISFQCFPDYTGTSH